ncbi:molybdenum cofactor biosynthesis protein MoaC [Synergistales bacterium]|nr:molybdenum cofactor biosynthesis protein MoaC [Synergistales bacterium]GHV54985.1 molybdenum cofactor biosynthesis protein MoaC [Synergistales bacterium]
MSGGRIIAVCKSDKKGTAKADVGAGVLIEEYGLEGDAHGGFAHRQVSLIASEDIDAMRAKLPNLRPGSFAENLTTEGFDLSGLVIGDRLAAGECALEVSQIGKECHAKCEIFYQAGECIMPQKGIFCRVIKGGAVKTGDAIGYAASAAS